MYVNHPEHLHEDTFQYSMNSPIGMGAGGGGGGGIATAELEADDGIAGQYQDHPELSGHGGLAEWEVEEQRRVDGNNEIDGIFPLVSWVVIVRDLIRQNVVVTLVTVLLLLIEHYFFSSIIFIGITTAVILIRFYHEKPKSFDHVINVFNRNTVTNVTMYRIVVLQNEIIVGVK